MADVDLLSGTQIAARLRATATSPDTAPVFATTPVTVFLEGPSGRFVWRWRPSGTSSPEFTNDAVNNYLTLTLTSAWTAANLTVTGRHGIYWCYGVAATTQTAIGDLQINVTVPQYGPAPVTDPT
jgi:hypothetical protein